MNKQKSKRKAKRNLEQLVPILLSVFTVLVFFAIISYTAVLWDRVATLSSACVMSEVCMQSELNVFRIFAVVIIFVIMTLSIVFMMIFVSLTRSSMKKTLSAREFENILNGIASGVAKLKKRDGKLVISYANEGFYNMQGYTKKEYKEKYRKDAFALVNPKDLRIILERLEKLQHKECVSVEYRITTGFERQRWILLNVEMLLRNNEPIYMCTFTDVTKHKRVEDELILGNERLSLILEKIDNLIIEYDLHEDYVHYFTDSRINMRCLNDAYANGYVDEVDFEKLQQVVENCKNRRINQSIALKITIDGKSKWYELRVTTLFDINDEPVRAIARVSDIDFAYREKVALLDMSQKESMTGLYNKTFAEELIKDYMNNDAEQGALFVIDIDNFKGINDTLGHIYGDMAIKYVANELQSLFRSDDVVARMGGDEFLVYMRNIKSVDAVKTRIKAVYEAFERYQFNDSDLKIGCSMGVAIYEKDDTTFEELVNNADKAMYYCKRHGKNNYHFYDKNEMAEEQIEDQTKENQEAE